MKEISRCSWPGKNELMIRYHDKEWGVACYDDQKLFEYIVLDTFQAGLSWTIVLNKRESFRQAFDNFDPKRIAVYDEPKIEALIQNPQIIRNRLKIRGTVTNAQIFLQIQKEFGSFANYLWAFVDNQPIINNHRQDSDIGATSPESDAMSQDMKRRGFKFCGSTVCYAFMQGAGLVNDHITNCFRYLEVQRLPKS